MRYNNVVEKPAPYQSKGLFVPLGAPRRSTMPGKQGAKSAGRFTPVEGWLVLVLLAVALYSVVASIIAVQWVSNSDWLLLSPAAGLLCGLLIAKLPHLPQPILHIGVCLVGYWLSVWLASVFAFDIPWTMVLGDLRATFTGQIVSLGMAASGVVFFFYLSFLCFFLGYFGSWLVYRAHLPWLVVLVYISIMLVNLNYVNQDMSYLVLILVAALLLLVARMQLTIQVTQWKERGMHTDRQRLHTMRWRCMQVASVIVVLTLILSWCVPIFAQDSRGKAFWDHLNTAWIDLVTGRFSWQDLSAFVTPNDHTNFFGDQLTISNTIHLPTGEVLRYQAVDGENAPHYLEGFTFNTFDGHTWTSSLDGSKGNAYVANKQLPEDVSNQDQTEERIKVSITLPPDGSKNYIFAPANPLVFSVPTVVYSDETAGTWTQQEPLTANETYEATFLPASTAPDVSTLLGDSVYWSQYGLPAQYFQVPQNISSQVIDQAHAWTDGATDAYTALVSLASHLSDQTVFKYSLDNPPIPDNTDVISWLLQTHSGYCTYYATAMAIMGRMLGIPTRIVNGFSQGRLEGDQWVVFGGDAHSWVQAFFPKYGWINFDPTPTFTLNATPINQPQNPRTPSPSPTTVAPASTPTVAPTATSPSLLGQHDPASPSVQSGGNSVLWIVVSVAGFFLVIALLLATVIRSWWLNLYKSSPLISAVYWRFCRVAGFLGMAPRSWQTPYEYAQMISERFPQKATSFWHLTDLYVREHWGEPGQEGQGLQEADVKDLSPSFRSLFVHFFVDKFKRKP